MSFVVKKHNKALKNASKAGWTQLTLRLLARRYILKKMKYLVILIILVFSKNLYAKDFTFLQIETTSNERVMIKSQERNHGSSIKFKEVFSEGDPDSIRASVYWDDQFSKNIISMEYYRISELQAGDETIELSIGSVLMGMQYYGDIYKYIAMYLNGELGIGALNYETKKTGNKNRAHAIIRVSSGFEFFDCVNVGIGGSYLEWGHPGDTLGRGTSYFGEVGVKFKI